MKWTNIILSLFLTCGSAYALDFDETFADQEEMLSLESEIEDMLDQEQYDEGEVSELGNLGKYDDLDEILYEEELNIPKQETANAIPVRSEWKKMPVKDNQETSIAVKVDAALQQEETPYVENVNLLETIKEEATKGAKAIEINFREVFSGAPIIYTILFLLSTVSFCVWLYSMLTIRTMEFLPPKLVKELRTKLISNQFDEALDLCVKQKHFFCKMLASGILARRHGLNAMVDTMKAEGKRSTVNFWQKINILNEIAIIAPMLGLLGTVMGMFYAFYDLNRSIESVSLLFDGLGISVGTTVAGLVVAILAMILYSIAKYRLVRILASVENEVQTFATLIDTKTGS